MPQWRKRERLATRGLLPGFVSTVSEAIDVIGQYQHAGVDLMVDADRRNDAEAGELFASDVIRTSPDGRFVAG